MSSFPRTMLRYYCSPVSVPSISNPQDSNNHNTFLLHLAFLTTLQGPVQYHLLCKCSSNHLSNFSFLLMLMALATWTKTLVCLLWLCDNLYAYVYAYEQQALSGTAERTWTLVLERPGSEPQLGYLLALWIMRITKSSRVLFLHLWKKRNTISFIAL